MSFDLMFYAVKDSNINVEKISSFLLANGCQVNDKGDQWIYENETTGVYFIFDLDESSSIDEQDTESYDTFDSTGISFNLNLIRPHFFGKEAFPFVGRLMREFDLYALNPQSKTDSEHPLQEEPEDYYSAWVTANDNFSSEYFDSLQLIYFPPDKSQAYWQYNANSSRLQDDLGENYFVPTMFLTKKAGTRELITISTWTEHIPNIFPPADYFILHRKRRKFLRTVEEIGVISRAKLLDNFGQFFEDYSFENCKIIHPQESEAAAKMFYDVKFDFPFEGFSEAIEIEHVTNAERSSEQRSLEE